MASAASRYHACAAPTSTLREAMAASPSTEERPCARQQLHPYTSGHARKRCHPSRRCSPGRRGVHSPSLRGARRLGRAVHQRRRRLETSQRSFVQRLRRRTPPRSATILERRFGDPSDGEYLLVFATRRPLTPSSRAQLQAAVDRAVSKIASARAGPSRARVLTCSTPRSSPSSTSHTRRPIRPCCAAPLARRVVCVPR